MELYLSLILLLLIFLFCFCIFSICRINYLYKLDMQHNNNVYECAKRWNKWIFESKELSEDHPDCYTNRSKIKEKLVGFNNERQYDSFDALSFDKLFWRWNKKKFITNDYFFKTISWPTPIDPSEKK